MSGGAPAAPAPVAPTFTDPVNGTSFPTSDALNAEITAREGVDAQTSAAQTWQDNQNQNINENQYQADLASGKTNATNNVDQYFTSNGYDPTKYASQIADAINNSSNAIVDPATGQTTSVVPSYMSTVQSGFSPNLGAQILQQINSGVQSTATNQIANEFAPTYAQDNVSSDWLAPAVSGAVDAQFDPLSDQLSNAEKRGTLNDTGYQAALNALTGAKTAATSTVSGLGQNILNSDRTGVDNYITGAKNDAAGLNASTLGGFDPSSYATGAQTLVGQDKNNFSGDLTNAIGSTQFSSLGDLLNAGGVVQGANDPTATNPNTGPAGPGQGGPISDAYIAQQALANQNRGLGSSGAF